MSKQYPCPLSTTGTCEYGGNKRFNHGFASGTASYCRHPKAGRFISGWLTADLICPKLPQAQPDTERKG